MNIVFPSKGVVRRFSLRPSVKQAEFGTPYAMNVRFEDELTKRLRGGSFVGDAPDARPSTIVYRNRTLTFDGRVVTASRVDDDSDTSLSSDVTDMLRPALFQFSHAGRLGDDVVALIPRSDQYLLGFTSGETWVLQGDVLSGSLRRVSDQVGICGANAWCIAHGMVYFLSPYGLYSVQSDGGEFRSVSEDVIPEDLIGLSGDDIKLDYDHATRSVSIHLEDAAWLFDIQQGAFWPFDRSTTQSHLLLGPFTTGDENSFGRILNLHGNIADGSDDVTWRIVTGDTAEDAASRGKLGIEAALSGASFSSYVACSGVWTEGRSHTAYPRTRTPWYCLWLSSVGDWAYETAMVTHIKSGRWR